jgi:hypothetical protein
VLSDDSLDLLPPRLEERAERSIGPCAGRVAGGEDRPGSDIDLLVDFEPASSLFDLLHLS